MDAWLNTRLANLRLAVVSAAGVALSTGCSDQGSAARPPSGNAPPAAAAPGQESSRASAEAALAAMAPAERRHALWLSERYGRRPSPTDEEDRWRVLESIDRSSRSCRNFIFANDTPIRPSLARPLIEQAQKTCRGVGSAIEEARPWVRDAEQAHVVSLCAAAYTEYERLQGTRIEFLAKPDRKPDPYALAVEAMIEVCHGRQVDLGS